MMPSDAVHPFRITVDDLGLYRGVETSVLELAASGLVLNCSWVTNYYAPSQAYMSVRNLRSGLHFNILEGRSELKAKSLTGGDGYFNRSWPEFLLPSRRMRADVEAELEYQLEKVCEWFGGVSHFDSHLHVHGIPWIYKLVRSKQERYGFEHIRNPYQPFSDYWSGDPRVIILWLLHLGTRSNVEPCFGIKPLFQMSPEHCLKIMRKSPREFIWHPVHGEDQLEPGHYRFLEASQITLRREEHHRLKEFLSMLRGLAEPVESPA
jgi:predicted glycoside hydrolase/deacetylase ChbG (UPF0249 family)